MIAAIYKDYYNLNDLDLLKKFVDEGLEFLDPRLFTSIVKRKLTKYVNGLHTKNKEEAWAVITARLAKDGLYFTDNEINIIAAEIRRLEVLRDQLNQLPITEAPQIADILSQMQDINNYIKDYFKQSKLPE